MNLQDILVAGAASLAAAEEKKAAAQAARLADARSRLAAKLPAEMWAALGLDPANAELDSRQCSVSGRLVIEDEIEIGVAVVTQDRTVVICETGKRVTRELPSNTPADNAPIVAAALAAAVAEARADRESKRARRFETWLVSTRRGDESDLAELTADLAACAWLTPAQRGMADMAIAVRRQEFQAAADAQAAQRAHMSALTGQAMQLARQHVAEWHAYEAACRTWAETETARLWRPWFCWEIRYTPVGYRRDDEETDAPICTVRALPAWIIRDNFTQPEISTSPREELTIIGDDGTLGHRVIGAFLDATPITFASPWLNEGLRNHRQFWADGWCVNVPSINDSFPTPPPATPASWPTRLNALDYGDNRWLRSRHESDVATLAELYDPAEYRA